MTWASELAQTLQEPTGMTRKWRTTLSFLYILIWQFLEGPRTQEKCQEEASSVSAFNGSVSDTAASAWGLAYTWESGVSATSHKDVATPAVATQTPSLDVAAVEGSRHDVSRLPGEVAQGPDWLQAGLPETGTGGQESPFLLLQAKWAPIQLPPPLDMTMTARMEMR